MAIEKLGVKATVEGLNAFLADTRKMFDAVEDVGEGLEETEKQSTSFKDTFDENFRKVAAIVGTVGAAIATAKKAFDFAEEGAQLLRLEQAGENLASSFGTSMDKIVEAVSKAANGTVANSDIILASNKAMTLGVASSAEQMAKLMEIAAVRAKAMGLTTTQAFSDIVTGIGRMSPMILDNLGILTGGEATFEAYAESIGKAADELDDAEKKQALFNKVLKETQPLLDKAAEQADDAATAYEQLKVNLKNSADEAKKSWSDVFTPIIIEVNKQLERQIQLSEDLDQLNLRIAGGYRGLVQVVDKYGKSVAINADEITSLAQAERDKIQSDLELLRLARDKLDANQDEGRSLEELEKLNEELAEAEEERLKRSQQASRDRARFRQERINQEFKELQTIMKTDLTGAFQDFQRNLERVDEREKDLRESIFDVNQEIANYRKEIQEIKDEEGPITESQQEQINRYKERIGDATGKLGELRGELGEIPAAVKEVEEAWARQTEQMIFNLATQRLAQDGLTTEELKALGILAGPEGFGLIDKASQDLIEGIGLVGDALDMGAEADVAISVLKFLQKTLIDTAGEFDNLVDSRFHSLCHSS